MFVLFCGFGVSDVKLFSVCKSVVGFKLVNLLYNDVLVLVLVMGMWVIWSMLLVLSFLFICIMVIFVLLLLVYMVFWIGVVFCYLGNIELCMFKYFNLGVFNIVIGRINL